MRHPMTWVALVAVLLLANVAYFVWRGGGGPFVEQTATAPTPVSRPAPVPAAVDAPAVAPVEPAPAMAAQPIPQMPAEDSGAPLLLPVAGIALEDVHDTFDDARGDERRHEALDIMAAAGTPVLAVADGTIEKLFTSDRGGLTIYQFEPTGTWSYYYAHLQSYAPGLAEGMAVRRGDVLGTVGSTGNADPAAPHLHFAVFRLTPEKQWWTGEPVNPWPLLQPTP